MAEHGVPLDAPPVLGIALDGLGYGDDGSFWGGEFLIADYLGFTRVGRFKPVAMPGGAQAAREPWRNTFAHLDTAFGWERCLSDHPDLELVRFLETRPLASAAGNDPQATSILRRRVPAGGCSMPSPPRSASAASGRATRARRRSSWRRA